MTIYYFTSTGNCLSVAKKMEGTLISIPSAMRENNYQCEDDAIGLVFPVFGLSVPPLITEFIERAQLKTKYLFAVLTYGTYDAGAVSQLMKIGLASGKHFNYINSLHMQENYLPGFAMEKQKKPRNQDRNESEILSDIRNRKNWLKHNTWIDRFMSWTHQKSYKYTPGIGYSEQYEVNGNCTGCSTCVKICPTCNIQMKDGKVLFGANCNCCLACIQNCPQTAIHMKCEKSGIRYRNPEVSLAELLHR